MGSALELKLQFLEESGSQFLAGQRRDTSTLEIRYKIFSTDIQGKAKNSEAKASTLKCLEEGNENTL